MVKNCIKDERMMLMKRKESLGFSHIDPTDLACALRRKKCHAAKANQMIVLSSRDRYASSVYLQQVSIMSSSLPELILIITI